MGPYISIQEFVNIELNYRIPDYLKGIKDVDEQRKADLEALDSELNKEGSSLEEKISSGIIWRRGFPGMILDVQRVIANSNYIKLEIKPIHPHRADLTYKRDKTLPKNASPFTVTGLLRDGNDNFVLGIRGGNVERGKIAIIPGGHADYIFPPIQNPLETFLNEFQEEIGYEFDGQTSPSGLFTNRDTGGINIQYVARTDRTFQLIEESWRDAKDRSEHDSLFSATEQDITQLAQTGKTIVKGREHVTTPFIQDCFEIFRNSQPA